jgi:sulfotransferase family protein
MCVAGEAFMDLSPIYLAGIERSGTSLMFALLASHPKIAMTRRTNLWTYFYDRFGDLSQADNLERCVALMRRYKRLRGLQIDWERLKVEFRASAPTYARLFALVEGQYAERLGKPRWGDKSLNAERYADDIFAAYPRARIIHMIRDPRDRYASARSRWKNMTGKAGAGTAMWLESANRALRNLRKYPDQYMVVRYETLVAQPEETLHQICAFLGEEYAAEMLTMEGAPTLLEKGGNSSYGKRNSGIIASDSIARYRNVLSPAEIAFIQSCCGVGMRAYSYIPDAIHFSITDRLSYTFLDWPINLARMMAWSLKEVLQNTAGRNLPSRRLVAEPPAIQL